METMNKELILREFITKNFPYSSTNYANSSSLTEVGILDSTGMLEVIDFIENEFGITLSDDDLTPENLDSINGIISLVGRKG